MTSLDVTEGSWGSHLRNYKQNKSKLPWAQDAQAPREVITRYQKAREEREFDPILQSLRDGGAEATRYSCEKEVQESNVANAKTKAGRYSQTFNIVNNESKLPLPEPHFAARKLPPNTRLKYNILSNEGFDKHHFDHPDNRPEVPDQANGSTMKRASRRDFSVISNKYINSHEDKTHTDHLAQREIAAYRFWQTHDYNPLRAKYYDKEKESAFQRERREYQVDLKESQNGKLPPSMRESEGRMVDIVNFSVKDEQAFHEKKAKEESLLASRGQATDYESNNKARASERYVRDEARQLNRVADQRFASTRKVGYDIVTNESFRGRGCKEM